MSIANEITRLQNAKSSIKTAIEGKGVTVADTVKLDGFASLIASIESGGGDVQSAAGTITLAEDVTTFLVVDLDFMPNIFFIELDEEGITYDSTVTKGWLISNLPFTTERFPVSTAPLKDPDGVRITPYTNACSIVRGAQGVNTLVTGSIGNNIIAYRASNSKAFVRLTNSATAFPIIAGTYNWIAYKFLS